MRPILLRSVLCSSAIVTQALPWAPCLPHDTTRFIRGILFFPIYAFAKQIPVVSVLPCSMRPFQPTRVHPFLTLLFCPRLRLSLPYSSLFYLFLASRSQPTFISCPPRILQPHLVSKLDWVLPTLRFSPGLLTCDLFSYPVSFP